MFTKLSLATLVLINLCISTCIGLSPESQSFLTKLEEEFSKLNGIPTSVEKLVNNELMKPEVALDHYLSVIKLFSINWYEINLIKMTEQPEELGKNSTWMKYVDWCQFFSTLKQGRLVKNRIFPNSQNYELYNSIVVKFAHGEGVLFDAITQRIADINNPQIPSDAAYLIILEVEAILCHINKHTTELSFDEFVKGDLNLQISKIRSSMQAALFHSNRCEISETINQMKRCIACISEVYVTQVNGDAEKAAYEIEKALAYAREARELINILCEKLTTARDEDQIKKLAEVLVNKENCIKNMIKHNNAIKLILKKNFYNARNEETRYQTLNKPKPKWLSCCPTDNATNRSICMVSTLALADKATTKASAIALAEHVRTILKFVYEGDQGNEEAMIYNRLMFHLTDQLDKNAGKPLPFKQTDPKQDLTNKVFDDERVVHLLGKIDRSLSQQQLEQPVRQTHLQEDSRGNFTLENGIAAVTVVSLLVGVAYIKREALGKVCKRIRQAIKRDSVQNLEDDSLQTDQDEKGAVFNTAPAE